MQCDLNEEQARIAQLPGPVIVQGRSGTGKTEVLIGRVMAIATRDTLVSDRSPVILVITRLGALLDRIRDTLSRLLSKAAFQTVAFATEVAPHIDTFWWTRCKIGPHTHCRPLSARAAASATCKNSDQPSYHFGGAGAPLTRRAWA